MKLLIMLVFAVCTVGKGAIPKSQFDDFGCYWRDWNGDSAIPRDAVGGGVDSNGHSTYVAKSVYIKKGFIVPGRASPQEKKMCFEFDGLQQTKTTDIEILCVLNENRLEWVVVNNGDTVGSVVGDNDLCYHVKMGSEYNTIGRKKIGNEIQIGRVCISKGKFCGIGFCQNGKALWVNKQYEVLVYLKNESADTT